MLTTIIQQFVRFFTWWIVVAPWEQAIIVRLGKRVRKVEAGIYLRIPFIDRVFKQSVRRRLNVLRTQTLTTADRHVITLAGAIGFSIGNLELLYDTLESPNDTIENEVCALVSQFIGSKELKECASTDLEKHVMENLHLESYGLKGQEFYVTSFATSKAYRFIMGDMAAWNRDSQMNMAEQAHNGPPS